MSKSSRFGIRRCCTLLALGLGVMSPGALTHAAGQDDASREQARERRRTPVVDVFEQARDAVVNISSTEVIELRGRGGRRSLLDEFFDMPRRDRTYRRGSVGSGFVIHPDGYIVTNAHVVAQTTEQKAIFADGTEYDAQIIATDDSLDLAVLKIEAERSLPTLPLGRSDDLMIGETVIAIGNPLGYQNTVTAGVVSAVGRAVQISPELAFEDLIQTDASINPGNSGGPLLNVLGQLIGINSAIRGDAQNIGFAIPVDQLRSVLPDLLDVERRYRVRSGLLFDTISEPRVLEVESKSPAAQAGIRPGDVLLAIDSRPVHEGIDFDIAMINRQPGDTLRLAFARGGERFSTALELVERPRPDGVKLAASNLGLAVEPMSSTLAEQLRFRRRLLQVTDVEPGGPADAAGVFPGDILLALGRHYVTSTEDLGQLLDGTEAGEVLEIEVFRVEPRRRTKRRGPIAIR